MLVGRPPFQDDSARGYREQICGTDAGQHEAISVLPEGWREVVGRCLQKDLDLRFSSAREVENSLGSLYQQAVARRCVQCGEVMPAGRDFCPECTIAESRKLVQPIEWSRRHTRVPQKTGGRLPRNALLILSVISGLSFGVYSAWNSHRPEQYMDWAPEARLSEVRRTNEAWNRILRLEKSIEGSYRDRIRSLQLFLELGPDTQRVSEAREKLGIWEGESRLFAETEEFENRSGTRMCEKLARWQRFYEDQTTGFRQIYAWGRIQHWMRRVANYTGYAELSVRSATGLPPSDTEVLGAGQPDPYFLVLLGDEVIYHSRILKDNPSPLWEERVRIFIRPGVTPVLEIRDSDALDDDRIFRREIHPLPYDGEFRLSNGSIEVQLEILRQG
jgi:hypothetical protein